MVPVARFPQHLPTSKICVSCTYFSVTWIFVYLLLKCQLMLTIVYLVAFQVGIRQPIFWKDTFFYRQLDKIVATVSKNGYSYKLARLGFVWSQRGQIIFFIDHYGKFITNGNWTKSVCGSTQSPVLTHTKNDMIQFEPHFGSLPNPPSLPPLIKVLFL